MRTTPHEGAQAEALMWKPSTGGDIAWSKAGHDRDAVRGGLRLQAPSRSRSGSTSTTGSTCTRASAEHHGRTRGIVGRPQIPKGLGEPGACPVHGASPSGFEDSRAGQCLSVIALAPRRTT